MMPFQEIFSDGDISAIILSLKVATSATIVSIPLGFITAYILSFKKFPGKNMVDGIINLPLVLPPVVVGYLLLLSFSKNYYLGKMLSQMGINIIFSLKGAVIASVIMGFPLLVRSIKLGMDQIDRNMIYAAKSLGAGSLDTVISIVLPLTTKSMVVGMTLMFARSLGEFGATSIVAGNIPGVTQTVPLAIYNYTNIPGGETKALSLCIASIAISLTALYINNILQKDKEAKNN